MPRAFQGRPRLQAELLEKDFPREGISVGVQTVGGKAEDDVAGSNPAAVYHLFAIDHADDAAGKVVFTLAIHSRHLRGLPADERATRLPAGSGGTGKQRVGNASRQLF